MRLLPDEWSFDGKRILDFGSGAGRTLRHFHTEAAAAEFWGCDIDEPSIAWMQEHLCPPFHAWRSTYNPPLGLEHGTFDLVYAVSVFTHLTANSTQWLLELHRMLKTDGLLIATFMGRWNSEFLAKEPWVEDRVGMNILYHYRDWDSGGPAVLMSEWWVREHWGRAFDILRIVDQFQNFSWVVMRKRAVELSTDDVERPSNDPREYTALRHNIIQLQRELDDELQSRRARHDRTVADLVARYEAKTRDYEQTIRAYENSVTWRATRPVRQAIRAVRNRYSLRS